MKPEPANPTHENREPAPQGGRDAEGVRRLSLDDPRPEVTVHQLRIFWAVAHSSTMTKAAKQLGLAQPSMSQQLSKLEATVGTQLFHRRSGELTLSEAGLYLLPRAEQVLRDMRELEDGLSQFSGFKRVTLRIAGINSVLHAILPPAVKAMQSRFPDVDFDVQESAPADTLEMLHGRRIDLGLVPAGSIVGDNAGFVQVPVFEDPNVLVVPEWLVLDDITDPELELSADDLSLLKRTIQFVFGTNSDRLVGHWYDKLLPGHHIVARCRSYELAVGLVRAGSGICIAPALTTLAGALGFEGLRLYRLGGPSRRIVALVPSQYRHLEPCSSLVDALLQTGTSTVMPPIQPTPPFLQQTSPSGF